MDEKYEKQKTFFKELLEKIPDSDSNKESQINEKTNWIASEQSCNTESEY